MKLKQLNRSIRIHDESADSHVIETRASNLDKRIVEGYGVIWDSKNLHSEEFHRGAFLKSISDFGPESNAKFKIKFCHEHREVVVLFDELREDEIGLYFRTKPLDAGDLEDEILKKLKSAVFNNFSIGFRYVPGKYSWDDVNNTLHVYEVRLLEISVVGIPSDDKTFAIRSSADQMENLSKEVEKFILSLPKQMEVEARHLFAIYQSLTENEPILPESRSLEKQKPAEGSAEILLDLDYIVKNLKL